MNRRNFLESMAAGACLAQLETGRLLSAQDLSRTSMGVCQYSFSQSPHTSSAYDFLEYCHSLGAGGIQIGLDSLDAGYLDKLRRRAAELGMYLEVIVSLPKKDDASGFERQVAAARQAGAVCMRSACLNGRRYEDFTSLDEWKSFVAGSDRRIALALPALEKHRIPLGLENHKDWTADEMVALIERHSSEFLGVCLDTGNNLSLLDDPMDVIAKLAPFAVSTHVKNMAVEAYPDGFLLAEVPLGEGILDLSQVVETIRKAGPKARLNLEMITRDPLKIPCLTDKYWVTFPERNGEYLARTLRLVRSHPPARPLPQISGLDAEARRRQEEDNVKQCLAYARETLGLRAAV
ncbi:MAG TPA: TIM barrel protein [Terriglobia bacterium]|nr:TIM barrel protein [Terriglobia bacterium]